MAVQKHLSDYLKQNALATPHKLALVTDDKSLSWVELYKLVEAGASHISSQLLPSSSQQVIALVMPNSWQYVVAYLSVVHAGQIAMPVDVIYKTLEIEAVLNQIPPALVITDDTNQKRFKSAVPMLLVEKFPSKTLASKKPYLRLAADKQIASLIFTSGTTGKPKAAPYTHANHMWNIEVCSVAWGWTADDTLLISLRLSHWYGLVMGLSGALYHGSTLYLQDHFDATDTLHKLSSGQISIFTHGPQAYAKLLEVATKAKADLSKVRLLISGSGPLPPSVWRQFKQVFGQEIIEVYGSSETGRIASNLAAERLSGSPGRPLSQVQLKFSRSKEVLVKSPGVFPGYWQNPALTKKFMTADGFWRTGDIGLLENGRLVLRGRTHEVIRKNGYSVSPRDVEWALHQNPHVKDVFVMGLTSRDDSDLIVYFVVGSITQEALRTYCSVNLPSVWRADRIIKLNKLPRSINGKPQLAKLKAMAIKTEQT